MIFQVLIVAFVGFVIGRQVLKEYMAFRNQAKDNLKKQPKQEETKDETGRQI